MKKSPQEKKQASITEIVRKGLIAGKDPLAIRNDVKKAWPKSALAKCPDDEVASRISWYGAKARADGVKLPKKGKKAKARKAKGVKTQQTLDAIDAQPAKYQRRGLGMSTPKTRAAGEKRRKVA